MDEETQKNTIDKEIEKILSLMEKTDALSDDYVLLRESLGDLIELKKKNDIFRDSTLMSSVTNLAGILLILNFEKLGIVTSKAFGLIKRV